MLRNFIRDRGTQLTLGTFVATFVYAVLDARRRSARAPRGEFVPHISITVTLVLMVADLAVLIYFLHHIAIQIQLPQVIAGIAADLAAAIELQVGDAAAGARTPARRAADRGAGRAGRRRGRAAQRLPAVHPSTATLVRIAAEVDAVIHVRYRPGHFLVQGHPYATVWPASAADQVARELARAHVTGPYRTLAQDVSFGIDQLVEIAIRALSTAVNDTFTALTCIDWIGDSLCKVTGRWQPTQVYRDAAGYGAGDRDRDHLRPAGPARRSRRSGRPGTGMPAVLIRQLDALAKIMERATAPRTRQVLLDQAAMIERLSETSVGEASDRADIRRAYQAVLDVHADLGSAAAAADLAPARGPRAQASRRCSRTAADGQQHRRPEAEHPEALPGASSTVPDARWAWSISDPACSGR